jgi:hypothetical protein
MANAELQVNSSEVMGTRLQRVQQNAIGAALVGLALCAVGFFVNGPQAFFPSYLFAYLFWFGVTTGSLALLLLHHTVGGGWGYVIRAFLEAATRLLLPVLLLFIPVVIGLLGFGLYEWTHAEAATDPILQAKSAYLNVPFFLVRVVVYFAIWMVFATLLNRWGGIQYERVDHDNFSRLTVLGASGMVVYVLTLTFAFVDWVMSLTPHWFSSIYGLLAIVSQGLSTLALMMVLFAYLTEAREGPAGRAAPAAMIPSGYFRDLGNLMLAFVLLWAYMSFSQYVITYSGNTTEEISWYLDRRQGGWGIVSLVLIPLHFALPFLILLIGSGIKREPKRLAKVGAFLILMRFIDLFWWVAPTFRPTLTVHFADVGAPLLLGGIWLWLWAGQMKDRPLVPVYDPRLQEAHAQHVLQHGAVEHG